jgi:DNA-binding transcriptional MerR regulator
MERESGKFWTASDVARYVGCSVQTVLNWERSGRFVSAAKSPTGRLLFDRADVVEFFDKECV